MNTTWEKFKSVIDYTGVFFLFFDGKEKKQKKAAGKKASFFPVGTTMIDNATALPS